MSNVIQEANWKFHWRLTESAGIMIYLDVDGRLDRTLECVAAAGGRISMPKFQLPHGEGWIAQIIDTEGNRVGLHANS